MAAWVQLHLTTPHMQDDHGSLKGSKPVAYAQRLLNRYLGSGYHVNVDGQYGLHTAQAVKRAKTRLGYSARHLRSTSGEVAGGQFMAFLQNPKTRPAVMKARAAKRRVARARRAAMVPKRVHALRLAIGQRGVSESPPGSNRNRFTAWYGVVGPWCAMFGTWAGVTAGQRSFARGSRYAYCPYVTADAVAGRNGLSVTHDPLPGDLVILTWGENPMGDHFARFSHWVDRAAGRFATVEGNTSIEGDTTGSQSNGGIVALRDDRYTANVVHFVRVAE